jgi:hypothetical protein
MNEGLWGKREMIEVVRLNFLLFYQYVLELTGVFAVQTRAGALQDLHPVLLLSNLHS